MSTFGRWKRRRLAVERDFVEERFELPNRGSTLRYKQPEGQFSNPNADCEVHCLGWLCRQAEEIRACATTGSKLLELHCGGGCNTVALAPYFSSVVAVEINRVLAEAAEENMRTNHIENVCLVRAASATADGYCHAAGAHVDTTKETVLVDPPRSGLDAETRCLVSGFGNVLYISCNPDALAQDLLLLSSTHEVVNFIFFDMFPYTSHSECAVRLRRRNSVVAFFPYKVQPRKFLLLAFVCCSTLAVASAAFLKRWWRP